jgi:hypothetical protein
VIAQLLAKDTLATIATQFFTPGRRRDYTPTALTSRVSATPSTSTHHAFVVTVLVTTWMLRDAAASPSCPIAGGWSRQSWHLVFVVILPQPDPAFTTFLDRTRL